MSACQSVNVTCMRRAFPVERLTSECRRDNCDRCEESARRDSRSVGKGTLHERTMTQGHIPSMNRRGHPRMGDTRTISTRRGESAGRLPDTAELGRRFGFRRVRAFSIQNEFPSASQEQSRDGKVLPTEAGCRFPFVAIFVGALKAHLVIRDVSAVSLRVVFEDAGGDAAQTESLDRLRTSRSRSRLGGRSCHRKKGERNETLRCS